MDFDGFGMGSVNTNYYVSVLDASNLFCIISCFFFPGTVLF